MKANWIQTSSGRHFDLADPQPDMVHLPDIVHALSNLCRFTGHGREHYSVAQHSVLVARQVPPADRLVALMHDAAEAYVGDVSSPLKAMLPEYRAIEARVWAAICAKFDLPTELPPSVKRADLVLLATEARDVMGVTHFEPGLVWSREAPLPERISASTPFLAAYDFNKAFRAYAAARAGEELTLSQQELCA